MRFNFLSLRDQTWSRPPLKHDRSRFRIELDSLKVSCSQLFLFFLLLYHFKGKQF